MTHTSLHTCAAAALLLMAQLAGADGLCPYYWTQEEHLVTHAEGVGSAYHNGRLYAIGGYNGMGLDTVHFNQLLADGSLGTWTATTPLPTIDGSPGVAVYDDHIYVSSPTARSFYMATVNPDGTVDTWLDVPPPLPNAPFGYRLGVQAYEGYLYACGGFHYADVYYCRINQDGSLGPWTGTTPMPEPRHHQSVHFYNDRVYIVGGVTAGNQILSSTYSAPVSPDGSIGSWRVEASLSHPLWNHTSLLVNGELLVFGGRTEYVGGESGAVYRASIDPETGEIAAWVYLTEIPGDFPRDMGAVYAPVAGGIAFLLGGSSSPNATSEVWSNRGTCPGDLDHDGVVDQADLGILLAFYGQTCP